jgi:hypothetical protein
MFARFVIYVFFIVVGFAYEQLQYVISKFVFFFFFNKLDREIKIWISSKILGFKKNTKNWTKVSSKLFRI